MSASFHLGLSNSIPQLKLICYFSISKMTKKSQRKVRSLHEISENYFERFGFAKPALNEPCSPETKIIIVIPCFDEPALIETLDSLKRCKPTDCEVEVIVVINSSIDASVDVLSSNERCFQEAIDWAKTGSTLKIKFRILNFPSLPKKHAGVGLARKIGMDEALHLFAQIEFNGAIVCLDADCKVSENYLTEIENKFARKKDLEFCSIYFEHPYKNISENEKSGIIQYEMHLRYYVQALKFAGYPFAFHTVGSSMGVKAETYAFQGGMNKRKAGEDFYFLHKLAPICRPVHLLNAQVYPSPRISKRVPFGTGRAMSDWLKTEGQVFNTYNFQLFADLQTFFGQVEQFFPDGFEIQLKNIYKNLPEPVLLFLKANHFAGVLKEIRKNTSSKSAAVKKIWAWLNGFRVLKFVHFATEKFYPKKPVVTQTQILLQKTGISDCKIHSPEELLSVLRKLDAGD